MKEVKEMFWVTALFSLVMIIPVGVWQAFDFLGFKVKLLAWGVYYIVFTAALAENFLRKKGLGWGELGLGLSGDIKRAAAAGVAGAALSVAAGWFGAEVLGLKSAATSSFETMVLKHMSGGGWGGRLFLAWLMFPIALCEEIVFRGIILNYLAKRKGFLFALGVSSLLFALVHASPVRMAHTLVYGLVWGLSYRFGGGLAAPVTAHYLHNVSAFHF